jgi:hypothetical protein
MWARARLKKLVLNPVVAIGKTTLFVVVMMIIRLHIENIIIITPHRALSPRPLFLAGGLGLSRPSAGQATIIIR